MEQLLHYVWKHKLFPLSPLFTTDHRQVEVIDPGLHNRNAGPDFFNAKIKINGTLWVGNVEIHDKASDWYLHAHDKDDRYDNGFCTSAAPSIRKPGTRRVPCWFRCSSIFRIMC